MTDHTDIDNEEANHPMGYTEAEQAIQRQINSNMNAIGRLARAMSEHETKRDQATAKARQFPSQKAKYETEAARHHANAQAARDEANGLAQENTKLRAKLPHGAS